MVAKFLLFAILLISSPTIVNSAVVSQSVDARSQNGYHKSSSGDCEAVTDNKGKPRCPNGYHRNPAGICEQITPLGNNGGINSDAGVSGDGGSTILDREIPPKQQRR